MGWMQGRGAVVAPNKPSLPLAGNRGAIGALCPVSSPTAMVTMLDGCGKHVMVAVHNPTTAETQPHQDGTKQQQQRQSNNAH